MLIYEKKTFPFDCIWKAAAENLLLSFSPSPKQPFEEIYRSSWSNFNSEATL